MCSVLEARTLVRVFQVVAIAEAVTWLALLIAMFFKWVLGHTEAVAVPGMVHGVVFVVFVVVSAATAWAMRWSPGVTILALASSIPPFGTLVFEMWARRRGHLDPTVAAEAEV